MRKVELHVHLEGSIRPETVLHLARKNQVDLPAQSLSELQDWYRFRDFPHFVQVYVGVTKCIKDPDDIEFVAKQFFEGQARQNIAYSEATYTASTVESHCGIPFDEQMDALLRARAWAQNELGISGNFILDIVRGQSPDAAIRTVEWVAKALGKGVCALGIAGFESRGTKQYADVFREAQKLNLPVTAHAGETEGAWSIWETLEITGCSRVGHGVRALESPELVNHLVKHEILLEICPTSNVSLGVAPSFAEHPIQKLREAGVKVCVNSDDPPMFGTTLTDEFRIGMETFGWEFEEIQNMLDAAEAARFG
jgi:adenosine deaminase